MTGTEKQRPAVRFLGLVGPLACRSRVSVSLMLATPFRQQSNVTTAGTNYSNYCLLGGIKQWWQRNQSESIRNWIIKWNLNCYVLTDSIPTCDFPTDPGVILVQPLGSFGRRGVHVFWLLCPGYKEMFESSKGVVGCTARSDSDDENTHAAFCQYQ